MTTIQKEHHIFAFSNDMEPIASVKSCSEVVFETYDCYKDALKENTRDEFLKLPNINPATGPLAIAGAEPGDTLKVSILSIRVAEVGTMRIRPGAGVLKRCVEYPEVRKLKIENGYVKLKEDLLLPVRPMIGVIGVAPAVGSVSTISPGSHGGNMDTQEIAAGAHVYLPVRIPGALLAMGDLHAAMGDGEVPICGVEVAGSVRVQVEVLKGQSFSVPVVENDEDFYVVASAETADEACQQATEQMFHFLRQRITGLSDNEIVMAMGISGDLRISQLVNPLKTAKYRMPKALFSLHF